MLDAFERRGARQIFIWSRLRKVHLSVIGRSGGEHKPFLELDREFGFVMNYDRVEKLRSDKNLEKRRHFGIGSNFVILDDASPVNMAAFAYFFSDVADLDHLADRFRLSDERTAAGPANKDTRSLKFTQCPVCGHSRYVELLHEFGLGRYPVARLQMTVAHGVTNAPFDRSIERGRWAFFAVGAAVA